MEEIAGVVFNDFVNKSPSYTGTSTGFNASIMGGSRQAFITVTSTSITISSGTETCIATLENNNFYINNELKMEGVVVSGQSIDYVEAVELDPYYGTLTPSVIKAGETGDATTENPGENIILRVVFTEVPVTTIDKTISTMNDLTLATTGKYCDKNIKISIDETSKANLIAENIKKDVSILGITGTLEQTKTEEEIKPLMSTLLSSTDISMTSYYDIGLFTTEEYQAFETKLNNGEYMFDKSYGNIGVAIEPYSHSYPSGTIFDQGIIEPIQIGQLDYPISAFYSYKFKMYGYKFPNPAEPNNPTYFVYMEEIFTCNQWYADFGIPNVKLGENIQLTEDAKYPFKLTYPSNPFENEYYFTYVYKSDRDKLFRSIVVPNSPMYMEENYPVDFYEFTTLYYPDGFATNKHILKKISKEVETELYTWTEITVDDEGDVIGPSVDFEE